MIKYIVRVQNTSFFQKFDKYEKNALKYISNEWKNIISSGCDNLSHPLDILFCHCCH